MKAQVVGGFIALFSLLTWEVNAGVVEGFEQLEDFNNIIDASGEVDEIKSCKSCFKIGDHCYVRRKLFELPGSFGDDPDINKLGVLRTAALLYYSFQAPFSDSSAQSYVGYVALNKPSKWGIVSSKGALQLNYSTFDINHRENKIYLGSGHGIWAIDEPNTVPPTVRFAGALNSDIVDVVSKDFVYYTRKDFAGIIKNKTGGYDFILEGNQITKFVVDKYVEYNVVYLNKTGLFAFNSKSKQQVRLHPYPFFKGITLDSDGFVYAWRAQGLYKVIFNADFSKSTVKQISDLEFNGGLAFDYSNTILYNEGKLLFELTNQFTTDC